MSKQAFKRVRRHLKMEVNRNPLDAYAWPGGYPMFYLFADGGCICPKCVNDNIAEIDEGIKAMLPATSDERYHLSRSGQVGGWAIDGADVNYEDADLACDHCNKSIPAAYAD